MSIHFSRKHPGILVINSTVDTACTEFQTREEPVSTRSVLAACPYCGKFYRGNRGVSQHVRAAHPKFHSNNLVQDMTATADTVLPPLPLTTWIP